MSIIRLHAVFVSALAALSLTLVTSGAFAKTAHGGVSSGKYTLAPASVTGSRLDATDRSKKAGTQLQIWKAGGNVNQTWILTKAGDGWYKIQPSYDTALAVEVKGNVSKDGTAVVLAADNGSAGELWALKPVKGGFSLAPKCAPNARLDVTGWGSTDGTKIQIWSATGKQNQTWALAGK